MYKVSCRDVSKNTRRNSIHIISSVIICSIAVVTTTQKKIKDPTVFGSGDGSIADARRLRVDSERERQEDVACNDRAVIKGCVTTTQQKESIFEVPLSSTSG